MIRPCILAGSRPGGIVLDPFIGSGTTAEVCIEEGRDYIGIELNPDYVQMANKRISQAIRKPKQIDLFSKQVKEPIFEQVTL